MLLSWRHFNGIAFMALIIGSYCFAYFARNTVEPNELFKVLLVEITRFTAIGFGWWAMNKNVFLFLVNMAYPLLPWSILAVLLFSKGVMQADWNDQFLRYNALLIQFNAISLMDIT